MNKIELLADASGYSVGDDSGVDESGVPGPALRMRRDKLNNAAEVTVQWTVNSEEYAYLRSVYRYSESNGNPPFLIDLIIHSDVPEEYEAKFARDGLSLLEVSGDTFVVQAQIFARPVTGRPSNPEYPS